MNRGINRPYGVIYFCALVFFLILLFASYVDMFGQSPNWTGSGTKSDPYVITTPQGLEDLSNNTYYAMDGNFYFALGNDIDMTGRGDWNVVDGSGTEYWKNHLDGRHHRIIKLDLDYNVTSTGNAVRGMFFGIGWDVTAADTNNSIIKNLIFDSTLVGGTINGPGSNEQYFGILSGYISVVRQSYWGGPNEPIATPAIDSLVIENSIYSGILVNSFNRQSMGSVSGYAVGGKYNRIIVRDTMNVASQSITQDFTSDDNSNQFGGLFGLMYTGGRILKSAFEGAINYTEYNGGAAVGGLVGKVWNTVKFYDCYFNGSINVTENSTYTAIGGVFGARKSTSGGLSNITQIHGVYVVCDMPNEVAANDYYGLIYGYTGANALAENTYANNSFTNTNNYGHSTTSPPFEASGMADADIGKTTTQMQTQSTFEASEGYPFDFTNVWGINASEYPHLLWTVSTPGPTPSLKRRFINIITN